MGKSKNTSANLSKQIKNFKLSFISVVLMVFNSCIGIGIFIKAGEISNNFNVDGIIRLSFAICPIVISIIGVCAMTLTFSELCSATHDNKEGIIG
jgi:hypothetical protein